WFPSKHPFEPGDHPVTLQTKPPTIMCRQVVAWRLRRAWAAQLVLWLVLLVPAHAQFQYVIENGKVTITGYSGPGGAVTIPDTIASLPVTRIGDFAFELKGNLTSMMIGSGVTNIGYGAFHFCPGLKAIEVDSGNPAYRSVEGVLFNKDQTTLIQHPEGLGGSYIVPDTVIRIGDAAFLECDLTGVILGDQVAVIGNAAFQYCTLLSTLSLGSGVTRIGDGAFLGCSLLTGLTIPDSVTDLGDQVFSYCARLTDVTWGRSVGRVGNEAFANCISLKSVTVPDSVTTIGDYAFFSCTGLSDATLGAGVARIGELAFGGCTSLASLDLGRRLTVIGMGAFNSCSSLSNVTVPNTVTHIADYAFGACRNLTGIYFRGGVPDDPGGLIFADSDLAVVYYLPGTTGWGPTFSGRSTAGWRLPFPVILSNGPDFGITAEGFGFWISWATNGSVVVEASPGLDVPAWTPVSTNTLNRGSTYFSDTEENRHAARLYRLITLN
ncbi:MAG: leucine-rich repeat domain-containing protein, partial [Verrucomicrobiales bacterium]|nr:leucine-rich repeat domain-containing protein [Verrucomicrobiales bacterium]